MLAADAVAVEPVSAAKFPANMEINREFRRKNREFDPDIPGIVQIDCRMTFSEGTGRPFPLSNCVARMSGNQNSCIVHHIRGRSSIRLITNPHARS